MMSQACTAAQGTVRACRHGDCMPPGSNLKACALECLHALDTPSASTRLKRMFFSVLYACLRGLQVYRARVRATGEEVAVKVQRPAALGTISKVRGAWVPCLAEPVDCTTTTTVLIPHSWYKLRGVSRFGCLGSICTSAKPACVAACTRFKAQAPAPAWRALAQSGLSSHPFLNSHHVWCPLPPPPPLFPAGPVRAAPRGGRV